MHGITRMLLDCKTFCKSLRARFWRISLLLAIDANIKKCAVYFCIYKYVRYAIRPFPDYGRLATMAPQPCFPRLLFLKVVKTILQVQ